MHARAAGGRGDQLKGAQRTVVGDAHGVVPGQRVVAQRFRATDKRLRVRWRELETRLLMMEIVSSCPAPKPRMPASSPLFQPGVGCSQTILRTSARISSALGRLG